MQNIAIITSYEMYLTTMKYIILVYALIKNKKSTDSIKRIHILSENENISGD